MTKEQTHRSWLFFSVLFFIFCGILVATAEENVPFDTTPKVDELQTNNIENKEELLDDSSGKGSKTFWKSIQETYNEFMNGIGMSDTINNIKKIGEIKKDIDIIKGSWSSCENKIEEIKNTLNVNKSKYQSFLIILASIGGFVFFLNILFFTILLKSQNRNKNDACDILKKLKETIAKENTEQFNKINKQLSTQLTNLDSKVPSSMGIADKVKIEMEKIIAKIPRGNNEEAIKTLSKEIQDIKGILPDLKRIQNEMQDMINLHKDLSVVLDDKKAALAKREQLVDKEISTSNEKVRQETTLSVRRTVEGEIAELGKKITSLQNDKERISADFLRSERDNSVLLAKIAKAEETGFERGLKSNADKLAEEVRKNGQLTQQISLAQEQMKAQWAIKENDIRSTIEKKFETQLSNMQGDLRTKDSMISEINRKCSEMEATLSKEVQKNATLIAAEKEEKVKQETIAKENLNLKQNIDSLTIECNAIKEASESQKNTISQLETQNAEQKNALQKQENFIDKLQASIYPKQMLDDESFLKLKEHLEDWTSKGIDTVGIIQANLNMFAKRELLNADSWKLALKNISVGVALSLRQLGASEGEIVEEMAQWGKYLYNFHDEKFDFALQIPRIGDPIDSSWMSAKNSRSTVVKKVLSWAVFHRQFGIQHNADVE